MLVGFVVLCVCRVCGFLWVVCLLVVTVKDKIFFAFAGVILEKYWFSMVLFFFFVLEYYWKSIGLLWFYISFCIGKVLD